MDSLQKIRRVSLIMQSFAVLLLIVLPLYHVMSWFLVDAWLQTHLAHRGIHVTADQIAQPNLVFGFLVQTVPLAIQLAVVHGLYRLFSAYRRGEVFTLSSIDRFRTLARTLFIFTMVNPLAGAMVSIIATSGLPAGQRMLVIGFGDAELAALIAGGVLATIGWTMVEAKRLADDSSQIV